jgi:hypothetical protein
MCLANRDANASDAVCVGFTVTTCRHLIVPDDIAAVLAEYDVTIATTATATATKLQYQATVDFENGNGSSSSDSRAPRITIGAWSL